MSFPGDAGQCNNCGYFKTWKHKVINPKSGKGMPAHINTQEPGVSAPVLGTGECAKYQKGLQVAQQPIEQLTQGTPWETPIQVPQQAPAAIQPRSWTPAAPAPAAAPAPVAPVTAPVPAGNADLITWLQENLVDGLTSPLADALGTMIQELRDIKGAIVRLDDTMTRGVEGALANASLATRDPTLDSGE